jgi:5'(3')-deoxyribonucleotidase
MVEKIIKIDCDGILRDMLPLMCQVYNDYYNENLTPDDIKYFDVNKVFTKCQNAYDFFFKEHSKFIYLNSPKCEKAKEAMDLLHEKGYHIIIVSTQQTIDRQFYTLQWLKDNDIYYDSICFTTEKQIISGNIVVDDYENNLLKCHEKKKILIDAPYNKEEQRFKRYNNLYEYVKSLK